MNIPLPYGESYVDVSVPDDSLIVTQDDVPGLADEGEAATLAACLHRKRRLNAAYLQAWQQEPGLHFEQFVRASSP